MGDYSDYSASGPDYGSGSAMRSGSEPDYSGYASGPDYSYRSGSDYAYGSGYDYGSEYGNYGSDYSSLPSKRSGSAPDYSGYGSGPDYGSDYDSGSAMRSDLNLITLGTDLALTTVTDPDLITNDST